MARHLLFHAAMSLSNARFRILSILLVAVILIQPAVASAAEIVTSAAVVPKLDGDADEEAEELARSLSDLLRLMTDCTIVDSKRAREIVEYADGSSRGGEEEIRRLIASAKEHHFAFASGRARGDIDRAIGLVEGRKFDRVLGPVALDAYLTKALIENSEGKRFGVDEGLRGALSVDPTFEPADGSYPPSIIERIEEIKGERRVDELGSLLVKSKPEGAEVYLNGIMQGVSPLEITDLPAESYSLAVSANRYGEDERVVTVEPGRVTKVKSSLSWRKGGEVAAKGGADRSEIGEALEMADELKVARLILIDADRVDEGVLSLRARTVDSGIRAGFAPIELPAVPLEYKHNEIAWMANILVDQLSSDPLADPAKMIDPVGEGDPMVLSKRKKPITKQPLFWGAIGTVVVGALVGGIVAAMSGGGSKSGDIKVTFK